MEITGSELDEAFSDKSTIPPSPSAAFSSEHNPQKPPSGLKSYLQRANFDLDIGFAATASSSRPKAKSLSSQVKAKAEAKSSSIDGEHKIIEPTDPVAPTSSASEAARHLTQTQLITKEHNLPVHLLSHTLRSTSLNSTQPKDDMGGPGLQSSRFARVSPKNDSYNISVAPKFPAFPTKPSQEQPPAPSSNGSNVTNGNRALTTPTPSDSVFVTPLQNASGSTCNTMYPSSAFSGKEATPTVPSGPAEPSAPAAASAPIAPVAPTDYSIRLAQLKAKRTASKLLASNPNSNKVDTTGADSQTRIDAENEATRVNAAQITSVKAARVDEVKAEADRLEAQRIAKEKVEADRRAKIQVELDAILETIQKIETREQARIIAYDEEALKAKAGLADAIAHRDDVQGDKTEVDKLVQNTEKEYAEVKSRLNEMREKAMTAQGDLDDANTLVTEMKGTLAQLDTKNDKAVRQHEQELTEMTEKKHVLQKNYDHHDESSEDVPAPYAVPQVAAMEVFDIIPVPVNKPCEAEVKSAEEKPPVIAQNGNSKCLPTNGVNNGLPTLAAWPSIKPRAPSVVRSVRIENLPTTYTSIGQLVCLVFHGALHSIRYEPGMPTAEVTFLKAEDCKKYLDATENGITDMKDPTRTIITKPCPPESGEMEAFKIMIQKNLTRNIRVVGISEEWKLLALKRMAEAGGRKIERLFDGHVSSGHRINDFRFCKVADAVTFKSEIEKDEEFSTCQIAFSADPCALQKWVHNGVVGLTE